MTHRVALAACAALFAASSASTALASNLLSTAPSTGPASNTGAYQQTFGFDVVPGIAGVQPSLLAAYSSRAGIGNLGIGWSVSDPIVALSLESGWASWQQPEWHYAGQLLVDDGAGRLQPEVADDTRVLVQSTPSGAEWFRVALPNGWMLEAGETADSRVEVCRPGGPPPAPGDPPPPDECTTVLAWPNRMTDPHGLVVEFRYADLGDHNGVYLTEATYTLTQAGGQPAGGVERKVVLEWEAGPEVWTAMRYGVPFDLGHRLKKVESHLGAELVHWYELQYEEVMSVVGGNDGLAVSRLVEILLHGRDLGQGRPTQSLAGFGYSDGGLNWDHWEEWSPPTTAAGSPTLTPWERSLDPPAASCDSQASELHWADYNIVLQDRFDITGDGLPDHVLLMNDVLEVCTSDSPTQTAGSIPGQVYGRWFSLDPNDVGLLGVDTLRQLDGDGVYSEFLDFNGDGHLDRLHWGELFCMTPEELQQQPNDPFWQQANCLETLWYYESVGFLEWADPVELFIPGSEATLFAGNPVSGSDPRNAVAAPDRGFFDLTGDGLPEYVEAEFECVVAGESEPACPSGIAPVPGVWKVWENVGGSLDSNWVRWDTRNGFSMHQVEKLWDDDEYSQSAPDINVFETLAALMDLTGDGIADYVESSWSGCPNGTNYVWTLRVGNGQTGFEEPVCFDTGVPYGAPQGSEGFYGWVLPLGRVVGNSCQFNPTVQGACPMLGTVVDPAPVHLNDFNGDGLADLVVGDLVSLNRAGRSFAAQVLFDDPSVHRLAGTHPPGGYVQLSDDGGVESRFLDFDGDGRPDWVHGDPTGGSAGYYEVMVDASGERVLPANLLVRTRGLFGGEAEIDYAPALDGAFDAQLVHQYGGPAARATQGRTAGDRDAMAPLWNVVSVTYSRDDVGDLEFEYENPVTLEREFRGYEKVTTLLADHSTVVTTFEVGQGHPDTLLVGYPVGTERYAPNGDLLSHTTQTWVEEPASAGSATVVALETVEEWTVGVPVGSPPTATEIGRSWRLVRNPGSHLVDEVVDEGEVGGGIIDDLTSDPTWAAEPHPLVAGVFIHVQERTETWEHSSGSPQSVDRVEWIRRSGDLELMTQRRRLVDSHGTHWAETSFDRDAYGFVTRVVNPELEETRYAWNSSYDELTSTVATSLFEPATWPPHLGAPPSSTTVTVHARRSTLDAGFGVTEQVLSGVEDPASPGTYLWTAESRTEFDEFGRPIRSFGSRPDGQGGPLLLLSETQYQLGLSVPNTWVRSLSYAYDAGGHPEYSRDAFVYLDEFGRGLQSRSLGPDAGGGG